MYYTSTRDNSVEVSSAEAILKTVSHADGGLFVPNEIPKFTNDELKEMVHFSYCEVAMQVLQKFLPDFTEEEIEYIVLKAYRGKYNIEDSTPMKQIEDDTYVLELWHSPTFSYKDFSLQLLPYLMKLALRKQGLQKELALLIATSGDSGKAALAGFNNVKGTKAVVLYPYNAISEVHRKQLITQEGQNIAVFGVKGDFVKAQREVRKILSSKELEQTLNERDILLTSANSMNWGRLLPNIIYYVFAYLRLLKKGEITFDDTITFSLTTGNFGSAMAGFYAREMGIPIEKLICVANQNRGIVDFIKLGEYKPSESLKNSMTPSVDKGQATNIERLLFHLSGNDSALVNFLFEKMEERGYFYISQELLQKVKAIFKAGSAGDDSCCNMIADIYNDNFYLLDPHTALQLCVLQRKKQKLSSKAYVVISTANPFEHAKNVMFALDDDTEEMEDFDTMEALSDKTGIDYPRALYQTRKKPVHFPEIIETGEIGSTILKILLPETESETA